MIFSLLPAPRPKPPVSVFFVALNNPFCYKLPSLHAEVVELVDTLGSGSSVSIDVGVRVSPSAPIKSKSSAICLRWWSFLFFSYLAHL